MRTTLDIDDDVLAAARELARTRGSTAGQVISLLARQALVRPVSDEHSQVREPRSTYGFAPFPASGRVVTNDVINQLRDDLAI